MTNVTVYRWVLRFTPLLAEATRPCRHAVGDRWQVDETYVKVAGRSRYVYRAIDQFGQVIDVLIPESAQRNRRPWADRNATVPPIVILCSEGYTSGLAAAVLQDLRLHQATDLIGGFKAWEAGGLAVTAGPGR